MSKAYKVVSIVFQGKDYSATGEYLSDGTVLIYKNSKFSRVLQKSLISGGRKERLFLEANGYLKDTILQRDYIFSSASSCASAIAGHNRDGQIELITIEGKRLCDYLNSSIKRNSLADLDDDEKDTIDVEISGKPAEEKVRDNVTYLPRNEKTKRIALANCKNECANTFCEHELFKKKNGDFYLEVHHLIPINAYKDFPDINIDIPENAVCLCPSCHREIHFGQNAKQMIESLYNERKELLESKGIILKGGIKQLLAYYDIFD